MLQYCRLVYSFFQSVSQQLSTLHCSFHSWIVVRCTRQWRLPNRGNGDFELPRYQLLERKPISMWSFMHLTLVILWKCCTHWLVYTQQNKRMQGFTLSNSKWTVAIFQQSEETCDVEMIVQIATCMKSSERQWAWKDTFLTGAKW